MWKSRDLALVILLSVVSFLYTVFVGQLGNLITGVLGLNYIFIFGHAIFISFGFLMYEGRRWRFLLQTTLVALLTIPTYMSGMPFDVLARIPMIIGAFFSDLILNSVYAVFRKRNRLVLWGTLAVFVFLIFTPFFVAMNMFLFYVPEVFTMYVTVYFLLLPVTIVEVVVGNILGYKIYKRIKKPLDVFSDSKTE